MTLLCRVLSESKELTKQKQKQEEGKKTNSGEGVSQRYRGCMKTFPMTKT
jgi:hypothetical protein